MLAANEDLVYPLNAPIPIAPPPNATPAAADFDVPES